MTTVEEQYGAEQEIEKTLEAAKVAEELLYEVSEIIKPGIKESEARSKALSLFKSKGIEKNWHNPYIRFGENTVLTYMNKATEDLTLKEEDIAFIDIGPLIGEIEGDVGHTLVFGNNPIHKKLKESSEKLFDLGAKYWSKHKSTGADLYEYLQEEAKKDGFVFNLDPAGHMLGKFPHKKSWMNRFPHEITKGVWVLEIQIRHPELLCGAFYERVLT